MSSTDPPVGLPQGVRLQRLAPRSSRLRNAHPEWEVWVEKERIGLIQQWRVASASSTFFRATAFHLDTGAPIPLESSTDLGERVEKVIAARHEPDRFIHKASWE